MERPASVTFLGVGSAFTTAQYYQSNLLITAKSGKRMLIDCGSDARFSLAEWGLLNGIKTPQIDAVYASHLHADHIGGLEWLAFSTYFNSEIPQPKLFIVGEILDMLWSESLQGGLGFISDKVMSLSDYFNVHPLQTETPFEWEGIQFTPYKLLHVENSRRNVYSYGLLIRSVDAGSTLFFSSDAVFNTDLLNLITTLEPQVDLFFQDTETLPFRTNVHAHYEDLVTLPDAIKKKMWLYHYSPDPPVRPDQDGFLGLIKKGQTFLI
ncbi:MAG: MBL fold metallo-hydrolase [Magnetococcales bacterium]|nr:MBL fold metallo-hydrolase [Magnetococcales bacterium]